MSLSLQSRNNHITIDWLKDSRLSRRELGDNFTASEKQLLAAQSIEASFAAAAKQS